MLQMSWYLTALCLGALVNLMAPKPAKRRTPFARPQQQQGDDQGVQLRNARLAFGMSLVVDLTAAEVESAYRHKAIEVHPDGRGDGSRAFIALTEQKRLLLENLSAAAVRLTPAEVAQKLKFDTVVAKYAGYLCEDLDSCAFCLTWLTSRAANCSGCTVGDVHTCGLSKGFFRIKTSSKKTGILTLMAHDNIAYEEALTDYEAEELSSKRPCLIFPLREH